MALLVCKCNLHTKKMEVGDLILKSSLQKKRNTITTKCDLELGEEKLQFIHKYHLLVRKPQGLSTLGCSGDVPSPYLRRSLAS